MQNRRDSGCVADLAFLLEEVGHLRRVKHQPHAFGCLGDVALDNSRNNQTFSDFILKIWRINGEKNYLCVVKRIGAGSHSTIVPLYKEA